MKLTKCDICETVLSTATIAAVVYMAHSIRGINKAMGVQLEHTCNLIGEIREAERNIMDCMSFNTATLEKLAELHT